MDCIGVHNNRALLNLAVVVNVPVVHADGLDASGTNLDKNPAVVDLEVARPDQLIALGDIGESAGVHVGGIGVHSDGALSHLLVVDDIPVVQANGLGARRTNLDHHMASNLHVTSPNDLISLGDVGQSGGVHVVGVSGHSDGLASHIAAFLRDVVGDSNIFGVSGLGADLLNVDNQMAAFLSEEITGHGHLVPFGYILLQHGVVLHTSGNSVVAAGNHLIPVLELDVHGHIGADLLNVDNQMAAFLSEEITGHGHLVPFGYILLQHGVVLHTSGNSVVAAGNHLIPVLELDVHGHIGADLLNVDNQMAAFLSEEITGHGHLVPFGYILLQHGVVLHTSGNSVVAAGNHLIPVLELDVHGHIGADLLNVDNQMAAFLSEEITGHGHLVPFGYILLQHGVVLHTSGNSVVAAGNHLIPVFELDVHDHIRGSLRLPQLNQSAVANVHITQSGQLIALGNVGQSRRVQIVGAVFRHSSAVTDNALGLLVPIINCNRLTVSFCYGGGKSRHR